MTIVGAQAYVPARPVGERCSHAAIIHDGRPDNEWCFDIPEARNELQMLKENRLDPQLSWAQHLDYWESIRGLVDRARRGLIRIADRSEADAKVIREMILELRPFLSGDTRTAFGKKPRHLRLYYGEPNARDLCLLALHLDTKEASEAARDEQNAAIDEALRRAHAWAHAS